MTGPRPDPPRGARHLVVVVLDSLRHDAWLAAAPRNLPALGAVERRFSYASWTAPSHYALLMGLLPHRSPAGVFASEYYKEDFLRYAERLGVAGVEFRKLLPSIYMPTYLRHTLGYTTHAMVSLPVLNQHTALNRDFDSYELMPTHNDMAAMVERLTFPADRPSFHLLNVGETHYPYALPHEDASEWPRVSGIHGVVRRLGDPDPVGAVAPERSPRTPPPGEPAPPAEAAFFDEQSLAHLRERQISALDYLDREVFPRLFDALPGDAWLIVTADHGELFGEDGYFGHGPIAHEKVLEVPFLEGPAP